MPMPLPDSARVEVSAALAGDLLRSAERLPCYDNRDYYSLDLQAEVRDTLRSDCRLGYDTLVSEVTGLLAREPYCVLVTGLEFDPGNRLFVGLNRAFGELVARPYKAPRAQLVHYIQPATDIKTIDGQQTETERLHTDTADWAEPAAIISMVCVRPDRQGGGRSQLLEVGNLRREVACKLGSSTIDCLEQQPVPWRIATFQGGGVVWKPVLTASSVRWRRYTIDAALAMEDIRLPEAQVRALDAFDDLIAKTDRVIDFLMAEGELLFLDNRRNLHSRTALAGGYQTSGRLMLRSWIRSEAPRDAREEA